MILAIEMNLSGENILWSGRIHMPVLLETRDPKCGFTAGEFPDNLTSS
jgi:hypothetical protein